MCKVDLDDVATELDEDAAELKRQRKAAKKAAASAAAADAVVEDMPKKETGY